MKCPNCNKEISDGFKFCPYCATPIVANKCPHCGSINLPADSKFCPDCGGKIESVKEYADQSVNVYGITFKMIFIEGGTFTMGATPEIEFPWDNEKPAHEVTLSSYYIGETEVTQALWQAVMRSNPSRFKGDQNPVENVSWNDCQTFISKLNKLTGKRFRLPTEAEWEFAARGGNKSKHYEYSGCTSYIDIGDFAWYILNSGIRPHPVKTKNPNELCIYDMSGNILEACQDWYGEYYSGTQMNPTGPSCGSERVYRGGGYCWSISACHVSCRCGYNPDVTTDLGLRLALSV